MPISVISGACPGRIPSWPSWPGMSTSATVSRSSCRSGVTTTNWIASGSMTFLYASLHLLRFFEHFLNRADHVERLLRNFVVLAFHDFLEAAHGVFDLDVLAFEASELCGHVHRLGKELLDAARAGHGALVFVGELFDAQDGDNVL